MKSLLATLLLLLSINTSFALSLDDAKNCEEYLTSKIEMLQGVMMKSAYGGFGFLFLGSLANIGITAITAGELAAVLTAIGTYKTLDFARVSRKCLEDTDSSYIFCEQVKELYDDVKPEESFSNYKNLAKFIVEASDDKTLCDGKTMADFSQASKIIPGTPTKVMNSMISMKNIKDYLRKNPEVYNY